MFLVNEMHTMITFLKVNGKGGPSSLKISSYFCYVTRYQIPIFWCTVFSICTPRSFAILQCQSESAMLFLLPMPHVRMASSGAQFNSRPRTYYPNSTAQFDNLILIWHQLNVAGFSRNEVDIRDSNHSREG